MDSPSNLNPFEARQMKYNPRKSIGSSSFYNANSSILGRASFVCDSHADFVGYQAKTFSVY